LDLSSPDPVTPGPVQPGHHLDLSADGSGHAYLIAGWSHPEPDYTWTLGLSSLIRLPLAQQPHGDYLLKLRCGPMVRPPLLAFQRITIAVNTTPIARLICRAPTQYELVVPAVALAGAEAADIVFHLPDAQAPKNLGDSVDVRELGIWVASLDLTPLALPNLPSPNPQAMSDKAMLERLQSLGENCELGFVQRAAGAEPLGLFRWASTPLPNLLATLESQFEGLGAPENLVVEEDDATEFQVIDLKYGFKNHSWAYRNAGARKDDVFRRECVRLPYLARLLREDLEAAEKLFCFHDGGRSGTELVNTLMHTLNRYGPNWLLWVCLAEKPAQIGTAELAGDRLIRGYIDQFQPLNDVRTPSIVPWMGVIRAATAIWQARRAA
jgi:hypothetical protein